jgi:hypothetical protein
MTYPAAQRWVAASPPGATEAGPAEPARYDGPPSYPIPPRWGFPPLVWRWPSSVPGTPSAKPSPVDRVRFLAKHATALLWLLAGLALIAAGGEIWRYVLLLYSRYGALTVDLVALSDALVTAGSVLAVVVAVLAGVTSAWWLYMARDAAVQVSGHDHSRTDWEVLAGLLVPGVNLAMAGSIVAELEHVVLRRPVRTRPRPSKLVLAWWIAWAVGGLLFAATMLWRLRDGVQAQADGVLLSAMTDLSAAAVAVLTAVVVRRLTTLLAPIDPASVRMLRVIGVRGAPEPPLRASRPSGATR